MNAQFALILLFLCMAVSGCGDNGPKTVTDGVDKQAIADYEAALKKVTSEEIIPEP